MNHIFDPQAWADLVVRSGAKYAGYVSEHADHFSLWDSQVNPVNSVNYGPILPLETKRANPYHLTDRAFCENWKAKVLEVVDRYDPDIIYFDSRAIIIIEDCRFEMLKHFYEKKKDGIMTYKWEDFPSGTGMYQEMRRAFMFVHLTKHHVEVLMY